MGEENKHELTLESYTKTLKEKKRLIFPLAIKVLTNPWDEFGSPDGTYMKCLWGMSTKPGAYLGLVGNGYEKYTFVFYTDRGHREINGYWHRYKERDESLILCDADGEAPKYIADLITSNPANISANTITPVFNSTYLLKEYEKGKSKRKGNLKVHYHLRTWFHKDCWFGHMDFLTDINGKRFSDKRKYEETSKLLKLFRDTPNDPDWIKDYC